MATTVCIKAFALGATGLSCIGSPQEAALTEQSDIHAVLRPHLRRTPGATQLYVDGRPMFLTAGEARNSSSSSREWMKGVWDKCVRANVNTVLAVVPWDLMEPVEGSYDLTIVDALIDDARRNGMRLVPLWFGAWKNGLSHYAPDWVKKDLKRFPRARTVHGNLEILSPFGTETRDVTARAFAALMEHIRRRDEGTYTAIMVQVENEVGFNGDVRDRHPLADNVFAGPVPEVLMSYLVANQERLLPKTLEFWLGRKASGTWLEVFGDEQSAGHVFMA
jgi:beta-galactosidase GanA